MANFNLDNIIGKCVHRPIASNDPDKYPLYKRNDGAFDEVGGKQTSRSDAWKAAVEKHYSSPNNIRRIFITREGVYVHFFRPFSGAKDSTTREAFYKYSSVNDKFNPMELYKAGDNRSAYKFGLGCLRDKWVCSNIEEIYFDWTLLLSRDLISLGLGNLIVDWTKGGNGKILPGDVLWAIFSRSCLKNGENISRIFPRLKVICYVNELNVLYNTIKRKPGEESAQDLCTPWYKNAQFKAAVADRRFCVSLYKVPNVSAINKKYSTRSYYCFDTEKLEPYFASVVEKLGTLEKKDEEDNSFLVKIENTNKAFPCIPKNMQAILDSMSDIVKYLGMMEDDNIKYFLASLDVNYRSAFLTKFKYTFDDNFIKIMDEASKRYSQYDFTPYVKYKRYKEIFEKTELLPDLKYQNYDNNTARKTITELGSLSIHIKGYIGQYLEGAVKSGKQYVRDNIQFIISVYSKLVDIKPDNRLSNKNTFLFQCLKEKYDPETGKYTLNLDKYFTRIFSYICVQWVKEVCLADKSLDKYKDIINKADHTVGYFGNLKEMYNDNIVPSGEQLEEAFNGIVSEFKRIADCYDNNNQKESELSSLLHSVENESGLEAAQQTLSMLIGLKSSNEKDLLEQLSPSDIERYKR